MSVKIKVTRVGLTNITTLDLMLRAFATPADGRTTNFLEMQSVNETITKLKEARDNPPDVGLPKIELSLEEFEQLKTRIKQMPLTSNDDPLIMAAIQEVIDAGKAA